MLLHSVFQLRRKQIVSENLKIVLRILKKLTVSLKSVPLFAKQQVVSKESGRGERIRTSDSYVPNVVLYQAELHPECFTAVSAIPLNSEGEQF